MTKSQRRNMLIKGDLIEMWNKKDGGNCSYNSLERRFKEINHSKASAISLIKYLAYEPNSDFYLDACVGPFIKDDVTFDELRDTLLNWVIRMAQVALMEFELRQQSTSQDRKKQILDFLTDVKLWDYDEEDDVYHGTHCGSELEVVIHPYKLSA